MGGIVQPNTALRAEFLAIGTLCRTRVSNAVAVCRDAGGRFTRITACSRATVVRIESGTTDPVARLVVSFTGKRTRPSGAIAVGDGVADVVR